MVPGTPNMHPVQPLARKRLSLTPQQGAQQGVVSSPTAYVQQVSPHVQPLGPQQPAQVTVDSTGQSSMCGCVSVYKICIFVYLVDSSTVYDTFMYVFVWHAD